jgi:hypothetical protein
LGVFQTQAVVDAILSAAALSQDFDLYLYPANAGAEMSSPSSCRA